MRKVVFGGASSLDGFIAREDQSVDWILWGEEAAALMKTYWARFDAILLGRKTYEVAASSGQGGGYPGVKTYVASRTLKDDPKRRFEIVREKVGDFVRALKQEDGGDICLMGGGELARSLFEEDVIDEVGLNIHPLLLGGGVPLFHRMSRQIDLELKECRPFKNGCVSVVYEVKRPRQPQRVSPKR